MIFFGPISSLFDFATFAILLWAFNANATLFRSGWFVESLATQSLAIFAIRTRRVPFFRSRPSRLLLAATLTCVTIGVLLPFSPLAQTLGFTSLPAGLLAALAAMIPIYLLVLELGKRHFYRIQTTGRPIARPRPPRHRRIHHRTSRWSIRNHLRRRSAPRYGLTVNGRIMSLSSCSTMWQWYWRMACLASVANRGIRVPGWADRKSVTEGRSPEHIFMALHRESDGPAVSAANV